MRISLSSLITRIILLCVIPLLSLAIFIAAVRVFDINSTSQQYAEQVSKNIRVALDNNLRSRIAALQTVADSPQADPLNAPMLYAQAQAFRRHFGGHVVLADTERIPLFNTRILFGAAMPPGPLPTPTGVAAAPIALQTGKPAVGDRFIGLSVKIPLVAVAVPVVRDGKVKRLLVNTIELNEIQGLLDHLNLPAGWHVHIVDSNGTQLAGTGTSDLSAGHDKRWTARSTVAPWQVRVEIPSAVFYRQHIETMFLTLMLLMIALVASIWLGRRTARRLYQSMATLSESGQPAGTTLSTIDEIESVRDALASERDSRREAEARWRYAIEGSGDGLWDWDMNSGKVFYSERWKSMLGFSDEDLSGHIDEWSTLVHPDDKQRVLDAVQDHLSGKTHEFEQEYRVRCKDGRWKWILARGMAMPSAPGSGDMRMIGTNVDITERKEAEAQIEYLAFYDPLTGLANRKLLTDRIQLAQAVASRNLHYAALLFIDLDGFKAVNDLWGHSTGDQMLMQVAQRMKRCVRSSDTIARLGGDEFVLLAQNLGEERDDAAHEAALIADKIFDTFVAPFSMNGHEFHCGASLGIALFRDDPVSLDGLLGQADSAMYLAKAAGGNVYRYFDAELQASLLQKSAFEADLRHSIHRGQLHLLFQPQVDVAGRIVGAESLVRWEHPSLGLVSPSRFIPVAEKDNFIVELGDWILRDACRMLAELGRHPITSDMTIAVNVSARQFLQQDFVQQVERALAESGASPSRLKLELTESIFAQDIAMITAKMDELHKLGITFALDDFGTGYSCLAYLKQLPFDQIKIDQAFVKELPGEPRDAAIVHTIIALCDSLHIAVIAEGVETDSQREFLELNGCGMFQGYLFSHPVTATALLEMVGAAVS